MQQYSLASIEMQKFAIILLFLTTANGLRVCETYPDYYLNKNCHNNPDGDSLAPEIIERYGYEVIEYEVITEDGYILTLFRIPSKNNNSTPVFLQHGLAVASSVWLAVGKDSLAFLLADAGYDVWLGNFRGTLYSQGHKTLTINDREFWNFSFHEMGVYDLRATLSFVAKKTQSKVRYIGHSMGTTAAYIYSIYHQEESARFVESMIHVSPIAFLKDIRSIIGLPISLLIPMILRPLDLLLGGVLFKQTPLFRSIYRKSFTMYPIQIKFFVFVVSSATGFDWEEVDPERIPVQIALLNDAMSIKTLKHYTSIINSGGQFRHFDYGPIENERIYGSLEPSSYDLSKVRVPIYLIYGKNDALGSGLNVMNLYKTLPDDVKLGVWTPAYDKMNHNDFVVAKDVKTLVYDHILNLLNKLH